MRGTPSRMQLVLGSTGSSGLANQPNPAAGRNAFLVYNYRTRTQENLNSLSHPRVQEGNPYGLSSRLQPNLRSHSSWQAPSREAKGRDESQREHTTWGK